MSRRFTPPPSRAPLGCAPAAALILFLYAFPDPMLAASLELRLAGSSATRTTALVGDVIDVDLWVDSEGATLSGAAVFLSFDEAVFELVDQDRDPALSGFQPFGRGAFLRNGEIFRNVRLPADDPAATPAGEQLDYSVVRAADRGRGAVATFRLRVHAPATRASVRIDESGIRETRCFQPDGSRESFRFITPLTVDVRGISIEGLPARLVLTRGQVDSTTYRLDRFLFDPLYGPDRIEWHLEASAGAPARLDPATRTLVLAAPPDRSLWEQLTLRAMNPDGQVASAVVDLFVDAVPVLPAQIDPVALEEDGTFRLGLDELVQDPDAPASQLTWTLSAPAAFGARIDGPPRTLVLQPDPDWNGEGQVVLAVADNFGFADTLTVPVVVSPVNDAPRSLFAPNLRVTRGKADSSLTLVALFADAEEPASSLAVHWVGADRVGLERQGYRLRVQAPADWEGSETIQLVATDGGGLTASAALTVTVVASLAPAVTGLPGRLGLAAGTSRVVDLAAFVVDPDDPLADLTWSVSGYDELRVQVSLAGAARIEAPAAFAGTETMRFQATDPSGASAFFDLLVFAAPPGGEPVVADLPAIGLPAGGVDASIDLDDYVFDLDDDPQAMAWSVTAPLGVVVRVDSLSHVLTVAASDSAAGTFPATLTVRDPAGHEARSALVVTVPGTGEPVPEPGPEPSPTLTLSLSPFPTLTVTAGSFDQSIVLDDYVHQGDPSAYRWEADGGEHTQVLVDAVTRRLTVLAAPDWSGPELVVLRAFDESGRLAAESVVGVLVVAPAPLLGLAELTEVAVLAGDSLVAVEAASLLAAGVDPASLSWEASGSRPLRVSYDAAAGRLLLRTTPLSVPGTEAVTLVARTPGGLRATGQLRVQVLPLDGSAGQEREGFRVAIVPNPVLPEFLDLFVISDGPAEVEPRLRAQLSGWQDLVVSPVRDGIWQASHVLAPGMEGQITYLALALEEGVLARSQRVIHVGTASRGSAKTVAADGFDLDLGAGDFDGDAVVAVIPAPVTGAAPELRALSPAYRLHATRPLQGAPHLSLRRSAGAAAAGAAAHVYRWDPGAEGWLFVGGQTRAGVVEVEVHGLGLYALFADTAAPRIEAGAEPGLFRVSDGGSGVDRVGLFADGAPVAGGAIFDGQWARLTDAVPAGAELTLRAADRAGNAAELAVAAAGPLRPQAFALGQNYPNPFNPETAIPLQVAVAGQSVRLEIFNSAGQRVRLLLDGALPPGAHRVPWDGRDEAGAEVSSGTYLYRAVAGDAVRLRRMTLVR